MIMISELYPKLAERYCFGDMVWLRDRLNRDYDNCDYFQGRNNCIYGERDVSATLGLFEILYGKHEKIKKVIFNDPATIIMWNDGSKTVVKCQPGDVYDPEKGFVMAYLKKLLGNDNTFNKEISKWVKE